MRRGHFGSQLARAARVFSVRRPDSRYSGDRKPSGDRLTLYRARVRCSCRLQTLVAERESPNDLRRATRIAGSPTGGEEPGQIFWLRLEAAVSLGQRDPWLSDDR